jgi:glycosyltransferase involved in cell wall biosynthesis
MITFATIAAMTPCTASVLIVNLHSPLLGEVLDALRRQTVLPLEVIVVGQDRYGFAIDDGWVRVFPTPEPKPPAVSTNAALSYARGDILCFLDADCIPRPDWLEQMLAVHNEGHLVVGGSTDFFPWRYWQLCDNIACQGDFLLTAQAGERAHLQSGNMSLRREVVHAVGLFDERFRRAAGEDTEYSLRLRANGYRLYFDPRPLVEHHTNRTTARAVWRHLHLFGRNWPRIAQRYRALLPTMIWLWLYSRMPFLAIPLIPMLALRSTVAFYLRQPELLRRHWPTLPGVVWARMGWYAGVLSSEPPFDT